MFGHVCGGSSPSGLASASMPISRMPTSSAWDIEERRARCTFGLMGVESAKNGSSHTKAKTKKIKTDNKVKNAHARQAWKQLKDDLQQDFSNGMPWRLSIFNQDSSVRMTVRSRRCPILAPTSFPPNHRRGAASHALVCASADVRRAWYAPLL